MFHGKSNWRRLSSLLGALCLLALACEKQQKDGAATSSIGGSPAAAASSGNVSVPQPGTKHPRLKEFSKADERILGTLPPGIGLDIGSQLPDLTLEDAEGESVRLHDLNKDSALMLVFYRGGWCPYCNFQIRSLAEAHQNFADHDVTPVAISVDQPARAKQSKSAYDIPFPVLSDPALKAHTAFNVINSIDKETYERMKSRGLDLQEYSGKEHHKVAIPSIFIVDKSGRIVWAHADADYKVRPTTPQLLNVIAKLRRSE